MNESGISRYTRLRPCLTHSPLNPPRIFHHAMVRGAERIAVFRDDTDPADFVARFAMLPHPLLLRGRQECPDATSRIPASLPPSR